MSEAVNTGIRGEDLQSYFQVQQRPSVHPGKCIVCGSVERPVVMLLEEVDYADLGYGALLICETCILQAASKFAPAPVAECHHVEELERWKQGFLDDLRSFTTKYAVDNLAVPVWGSRNSFSEQAESKDDSTAKRDKPKSSRSGKQADNATSEQGSAGVSGDSGNGSLDDKFSFLGEL